MSTEQSDFTAEELAAFEAGFNDGQPASTPAADATAPGPDAVDAKAAETTAAPTEPAPAGEEVDELAGLPPKVRAMLEEFETLKKVAETVPELAHRVRSAEGRVAALQKQTPAAPPPAPPTLPAVERIRRELPEVVDAMEEFFQSKQLTTAQPPAPKDDDAPTTLLDQAVPDWQIKVASPAFEAWLAKQPAEYQQTVRTTQDEPEMLRAVTRFDAYQEFATERQRTEAAAREAAQRVNQTRTNRAQAAVVPAGAGRRAPPQESLEAAFAAGFNTQRL